MEQTVRVVADSGCDLPQHLVDEFEIELVPLRVSFGSEQYLDGELSPDEFWHRLAGSDQPRTSQPSVGRFLEVFERLVAQGKEVLCVTITKEHSGTYNAARLAAQRVGEMVKVFDSASASLGSGLQALAAAQAARVGASLREIYALLKDMRERTRLAAVLDTLDNLRLGGRADAFIAVADRMTRALGIKLIITAIEGRLRPMGAVRSFRSGLRRLSNLFEQAQPLERLAVIHTRSLDKAQELAQKLALQTGIPCEKILVQEIGAALACHGGPGIVGVVSVSARTSK
jgi:DegV family protein with EDD domain